MRSINLSALLELWYGARVTAQDGLHSWWHQHRCAASSQLLSCKFWCIDQNPQETTSQVSLCRTSLCPAKPTHCSMSISSECSVQNPHHPSGRRGAEPSSAMLKFERPVNKLLPSQTLIPVFPSPRLLSDYFTPWFPTLWFLGRCDYFTINPIGNIGNGLDSQGLCLEAINIYRAKGTLRVVDGENRIKFLRSSPLAQYQGRQPMHQVTR